MSDVPVFDTDSLCDARRDAFEPAAEEARLLSHLLGKFMFFRDLQMMLRDAGGAFWRRRWRILAAVVVVATAVTAAPRLLLGPKVVVDAAVREELVETVVASGHVEAPYRVEIGSQITGIVANVPVEEGQFVRADATLIVLDDRDARAAVDQAESAVETAQARIRQMDELTRPAAEENLKLSQATLLNARQSYERTEPLYKGGFATRAQYDQSRRDLDIAAAQVRAAQLQLAANEPGGTGFTLAQHALTLAQASLRSARTRLAYTVIKAPRDGTLIGRRVEQGAVVQPGQPLMTLSPSGEAQLVVQIDEKNLGLIAVGQKALASADAYPNETFPAEVFYINPGIDLQRASVEVKLRVPAADEPAYLRQDMTVSTDIEVARKRDALVLPIAAVHDAAGSSPWVLKVVSGRAKKQPVTLGLRGAIHVEIISGLDNGDFVVPAAAKVVDGQRLRARAP
jgi:HlyD family secretion protein